MGTLVDVEQVLAIAFTELLQGKPPPNLPRPRRTSRDQSPSSFAAEQATDTVDYIQTRPALEQVQWCLGKVRDLIERYNHEIKLVATTAAYTGHANATFHSGVANSQFDSNIQDFLLHTFSGYHKPEEAHTAASKSAAQRLQRTSSTPDVIRRQGSSVSGPRSRNPSRPGTAGSGWHSNPGSPQGRRATTSSSSSPRSRRDQFGRARVSPGPASKFDRTPEPLVEVRSTRPSTEFPSTSFSQRFSGELEDDAFILEPGSPCTPEPEAPISSLPTSPASTVDKQAVKQHLLHSGANPFLAQRRAGIGARSNTISAQQARTIRSNFKDRKRGPSPMAAPQRITTLPEAPASISFPAPELSMHRQLSLQDLTKLAGMSKQSQQNYVESYMAMLKEMNTSSGSGAVLPLPNSAMLALLGESHLWSLDVLKLESVSNFRPLVYLGMKHLSDKGLIDRLHIPAECFCRYFMLIEDNYIPFPRVYYHNNTHGADVMHNVSIMLDDLPFFSDLQVLAVLLAAAAHDVCHPGFSNAFLAKTADPLAILYNDNSILENYHISQTFKLMTEHPEANFLQHLSAKEQEEVRKLMILVVLGTDMQKHAIHLAEFKAYIATCAEEVKRSIDIDSPPCLALETATQQEQSMVLSYMLHLADLSACAKPWPLCKAWSMRVLEEFFLEGDQELAKGLPLGPLNDRKGTSIPQSQSGFIAFVCRPIWQEWSTFIEGSEQLPMLKNLETNLYIWDTLKAAEKAQEEEAKVVADATSKLDTSGPTMTGETPSVGSYSRSSSDQSITAPLGPVFVALERKPSNTSIPTKSRAMTAAKASHSGSFRERRNGSMTIRVEGQSMMPQPKGGPGHATSQKSVGTRRRLVRSPKLGMELALGYTTCDLVTMINYFTFEYFICAHVHVALCA
eukprot:m.209199 g.209199  ORF g.209199 m.209199 type:complete len:905 (-) comp15044_c1_seq3:76-2790(-)